MDIYTDAIRNLAASDKLVLVEQIWDDLAANTSPVPLPAWALKEAARRRDEMLDNPQLGFSDEEVWKRIDESRNA